MDIKNAGTKHDEDKTRLDLIPPEVVEALGKVLTFGCKKYSANNWRLGIDYSRVYSAVQRHLNAFWGEADDIDEESGLSHLSHAFCGLTFLIAYEANKERYQTFDDRAGRGNDFYRQREKLVNSINKLVQDNPSFFECRVGDNTLQKVYDTLEYAIYSPYTTIKNVDSLTPFPDLTKVTHLVACKHLEIGMRVKVLCRGPDYARGWKNSWNIEYMNKYIGKVFTVNNIDEYGIKFIETDWWGFPAFVLEIVSRPEDTE